MNYDPKYYESKLHGIVTNRLHPSAPHSTVHTRSLLSVYETLCVCVCERETTEHCERESDPASTADGAPRERLSLCHTARTHS